MCACTYLSVCTCMCGCPWRLEDILKLEMWAVWLGFEELNSHPLKNQQALHLQSSEMIIIILMCIWPQTHPLKNQQALLTTVPSSIFLNDDPNIYVYKTTQKPNISFRHNFLPIAKVYYLKVKKVNIVLFGEGNFAKGTDNEHREDQGRISTGDFSGGILIMPCQHFAHSSQQKADGVS